MNRPEGTVEKFIEGLPPSLYTLGILLWVGNAGYFSSLVVGWGLAFWAGLLIVATIEYVLWRRLLFFLHRMEHQWWYRREHAREGGLSFDAKFNRFEIGDTKLYSYHELSRRGRNAPILVDPDRSY